MKKIENLGNLGIDIWVESWYSLRLVKRQVRLLFFISGRRFALPKLAFLPSVGGGTVVSRSRAVMRVENTLRAVEHAPVGTCLSWWPSFNYVVVSFPNTLYSLNNHSEQIDTCLRRYDIIAATKARTLNTI